MGTLRSKTIGVIQAEIEAAISRLAGTPLPPGLEGLKHLAPPRDVSVRVSLLRDGGKRKIRSDADASYWDARTCNALVSFEMAEESATAFTPNDPLADLVKTLDSAEREPRFRDFVGLKPFRDQYLVAHGASWAHDLQARHAILTTAIERGMVLRNSIPNPKDPIHPTTAIRLQREHPDVKHILSAASDERSAFRPIALPGPAISSMLMAERR